MGYIIKLMIDYVLLLFRLILLVIKGLVTDLDKDVTSLDSYNFKHLILLVVVI